MDSQAPSDVSIDTAAAEAILDGRNYYDVFDPSTFVIPVPSRCTHR
jgi:hypothetical protein